MSTTDANPSLTGPDTLTPWRRRRTRRNHPGTELRRFALFADCTDAELGQIASLTTTVSVEPDAVLLREGGAARQFLLIADGEVTVSKNGQLVAELGAGEFVGEMALLDGSQPSATVTARTPLTVLVSAPQEFAGLLHIAPSARAKLRQAAADRQAANLAA